MSCKLLIDGNSMINTVACAALYNATDTDFARPFYKELDRYVIKGKAEEYYKEIIFKYFYNILHSLNYIDNVYFCFDKVSWRKFYYKKYKDLFINRPDYDRISDGYKSNRKIDNDKKEQVSELVKFISNNTIYNLSLCVKGINFVSVEGLEGDDIIAYLTYKFKKDNDVFIWSNDSDLHQLLDNNVCILGPNDKKTLRRKMFTIEGREENTQQKENIYDFISENNAFLPSSFDNIIKTLSDRFYNNYEINPTYELFTKILCGDKSSDNIFPCYSFSRNGKIVNVTKAKVSDIVYESLKEKYSDSEILSKIDIKDKDFLNLIAQQIFDIFSLEDIKEIEEIKKGLEFNITMIRLAENIIPKQLTVFVDRMIDNNTKVNIEEYKSYTKIY